MNQGKRVLKLMLSIFLMLFTAFNIIFILSGCKTGDIRGELISYSPLFLEINFFLIIVSVLLNRKNIKKIFSDIDKKTILWLGVIVVVSFVMVCFITERTNRIYYDEHIYASIGQDIAMLKGPVVDHHISLKEGILGSIKRVVGRAGICHEGDMRYGSMQCYVFEHNKEPNGWPYVLSLVYRVFGAGELQAYLTNNLIFLASIIVVFLLGYLFFNSSLAGILSSLVFALTPEVIIWSNTMASEPSTMFFAALAILSFLIYARLKDNRSLFMAIAVTAFAVNFRHESGMILALVFLVVVLWNPRAFKREDSYIFAALLFMLLSHHLIHIWSVKDFHWENAGGEKFSFLFLYKNFTDNTVFYFRNIRFPLLFTLLFMAGFLSWSSDRAKSLTLTKSKLFILLWALLFWGVFILFYAGSYNYGTDVRFSLLSAVPIALMAGLGSSFLVGLFNEKKRAMARNILIVAILMSFSTFLPMIRAVEKEAWEARADHKYALEFKNMLPDDAIILSHNPHMFYLWGQSSGQIHIISSKPYYFNILAKKYPGGIYYHYDYWCNTPNFKKENKCKKEIEKFKGELVASRKKDYFKYGLYKLKGPQ